MLLIEDNEQNRYQVTFLLERSGYAVRAFADGARGIESARTQPPMLVLLDIQLPTMDGYAVARALRQNEPCEAFRLSAVTSYAMPGESGKGAGGWLHRLHREAHQPRNVRGRAGTCIVRRAHGGHMTHVLIVDDKEENLYYLRTLLEDSRL